MKKYLQRSLKGSLGAVSSTTTYRSLYQPIDSFEKYMIQIVWTGTPTATVTLQVSADPILPLESYSTLDAAAPVNVDTVSSSSSSTVGVNILTYEVLGSSGNWIGVKWVNASGTGTITAINFVGKGSLV